MSSTYLGTIADQLLDIIVAGLAEETTGRPAPGTTFISHGVPNRLAYCCEGGYATVYLDPLRGVEHNPDLGGQTITGAHAMQQCITIPVGHFVLEWGRCVPKVSEDGWPSETDIDLSASDLLEDLWAVLTELYDRRASGALAGADCGDITIGEAIPLEPAGGCAGWQVRLDLTLDDPGPTGS
jgi:hypothetical protein